MYLFVCLSVHLSICKLESAAILQGFLNFWSWQHIKKEEIQRDIFQKCKVEDGFGPQVLCLPRKSDARSYQVLRLSRVLCSNMQPLSGNQRPDFLTSLMNMSPRPRLPCDMHLCRSSSTVPRLPPFLKLLQNPHTRCAIPCACHAELHPNFQKWSEHAVFLTCFNILTLSTWKCASRHNGVQFF